MTWIKAASLEDLRLNPVVVKSPPKQIAVFAVADSIYAIDNRCPHEGYPLALGKLSTGCILTCNWHNWKFRLDTGECLIGGDHVRSYPTKIESGMAWIDIADPPAEESKRRILDGLKAAFEDRDFGRICREIARLHGFNLDPAAAVVAALEWAHDHVEFGTTHSFAGAADWLRLAAAKQDDLESRLICLSEAVDHFANDCLRQPVYSYAQPGAEPFHMDSFLAAVEAEDSPRAEAMVARAVADGLHWPAMEEAFAAAALAHYNDFGHSVIYVHKAGELINSLGSSIEPLVLLPLARSLCFTTREDLLPEFKDYAPSLSPKGDKGAAPSSPFGLGTSAALNWVQAVFTDGADAQAVYDRLLEALALSLLHFDLRFDTASDGPVTESINWLDFTHGITMASAARNLCSRYPRLWRPALAQMACFLGRNRDFIDLQIDRERWMVSDELSFFRDVDDKLLDHGYRDPIFAVHLLKTSMAVKDELAAASPSCRRALLAALNRFFNSPIKTKHVRRLARQAINLVSRDWAAPAPASAVQP